MASIRKPRRFFIARPEEFRLLMLALSIVNLLFIAAMVSACSARPWLWADLILPAGFFVSVFIAHGVLIAFGSSSTMVLFPVWVTLTGIGWVFQFRLGSFNTSVWQHPACWSFGAAPLVLAVVAVILGNGRLKSLSKLSWLWILSAFGICLAVLASGVSFRGAIFGPGRTTPTEAIKILLILGFSGLLARYGHAITRGTSLFSGESRRTHIIIVGAWLLPAIVLVLLGDLGMLAATGLLLGFLMTLATFRKIYPILGVFFIGTFGWLIQTWTGKGRVRFAAWLQPFDFPDTSGFQTIRSLFAVFNGEFFGRGLGNGVPRTIPLVETDFVYAAIAEEFGWLGSVLILLLAFTLIRKSFRIAASCSDPFSALVCMGCGAMWMIQVLLHVGGVIKLIPMTGVPFPGLSTGGTSLLVFAVITGFILAASDKSRL